MRIAFDKFENNTRMMLLFDGYKEFEYFISRIREFESLSEIIEHMRERSVLSDDKENIHTYLLADESEWVLDAVLNIFVTDALEHELIETQKRAIKQREKIIKRYEHMVWEQQNIIGALMQDETIIDDVGQTS